MKTKFIYTGFTNDGRYRIIIKKIDKNGNSYYVDLETKERFTSLDLDISNFVPFVYRTDDKCNSRKKAIKQFKSDSSILIHIDNLYIGDRYYVVNLLDFDKAPYFKNNNMPMDTVLSKKNMLFIKINDRMYQDIITEDVLYTEGSPELDEQDYCVANLRKASEVLEIEGSLVSKGIALTKSYKKFNK